MAGESHTQSDCLNLHSFMDDACLSALRSDPVAMPCQVYKFERLQPLSYYAAADQPQQKAALPWGAKAGKEQALADRCRMVRWTPAPCSSPGGRFTSQNSDAMYTFFHTALQAYRIHAPNGTSHGARLAC